MNDKAITANDFLRKTDYTRLSEFIRNDPIRLRKEFLKIATDPASPVLFRTRSLRILHFRAAEFGRFTPLEKQSLVRAFKKEFPPKRLKEIGKIAQSGACGHFDAWLLILYCFAIARITLGDTCDAIDPVREAFKGTRRQGFLEDQLAWIEMRKRGDLSCHTMEAG